MSKARNLIGQPFGRLTVIERAENTKGGKACWKCVCSCPEHTEVIVIGNNLIRGLTQSCGCIHKEVFTNRSHNQYGTRLYKVWAGMQQRCHNINSPSYRRYGAEGKFVCSEWQKFAPFYEWAMSNGYRDGLTIERIDNSKGYSPENCKWATTKEQANNKRNNHLVTYNGETHTLAQWAEKLNISYNTLWHRINSRHWSLERALNTP